MSTLVVPDTNVYLHFTSFTEVNWREIVNEAEVTLVVLFPVLQELDRLKRDLRLSKRARDVTQRIESLFEEGDTSTLRDGTQVILEHAKNMAASLEANHLDGHDGDERILAAILQLMCEDHQVVFVTDDVGARIRARSLGIRHCRMPERLRRAGADPAEIENRKLRRELDEIRLSIPKLELEFFEGGAHIKVLHVKPSPAAHSLEDALILQPLRHDALPDTYRFQIHPPSREEVEKYNSKLESLRPKFEQYFEERRRYELFPYQSVEIDLRLRNVGGRPADKVKVEVRMPEGTEVVPAWKCPTEPTRPEFPPLPGTRRGVYALAEVLKPFAMFDPARPAPHLNFGRLLGGASSSDRGPSCHATSDEDGNAVAEFNLSVVSNFDEVHLGSYFALFPSPEDVCSFKMPFSIRAHNLPRLLSGDLHVAIEHEGE